MSADGTAWPALDLDLAPQLDHARAGGTVGVASAGLLAMPHLAALLGGRKPARSAAGGLAAVAGWGGKRSGAWAEREARRRGLPLALLEDGFLRSVGLGKSGAPPVSLAIDDTGIYCDARRASRLERILAARGWERRDLVEQAAAGLERWRGERLSKYNLATPPGADRTTAASVVLVDQVAGDSSIRGSGADAATFRRMLQEALDRFPAHRLAVRAHPDVVAGKAQGCLAPPARRLGVTVNAAPVDPADLLDRLEEVWTISSGLGFEALLRGVRVVTFGMPFYAGWGLTEDRADGPVAERARARRGRTRSLAELFAASFLLYCRYADPVTRRPLAFDGAVDRILDWRRRDRAQSGRTTVCLGFSAWKQPTARAFLGGTAGAVVFAGASRRRPRLPARLPEGGRVAVWGAAGGAVLEEACRERGLDLVRVEDGFVRSVGLGSDLLGAGSLVVDDLGLHYDAGRPSRLERLLAEGPPAPEILARAARLRERLVAEALTKYNMGAGEPADLRRLAGDRPVVLVAEQVPGDAALSAATGPVAGNAALLAAARRERPDAFLVYKEHPDLVAGNRRGRQRRDRLLRQADLVLSAGDLGGLYAQVDELHVMTSLAGFEALLRGVRVVCWGRPFYAGWGLTDDRLAGPRRGRRLGLDELVAAALVLYPRYVDPLSRVPCEVEDFLDSLAELRRGRPRPPARHALVRQAGRLGRWLTARLSLA